MFRTTVRWVIVLFVLAILAGPGVMAQQPPAPTFKDTTVLPEGQMGARIMSLIETMNSGSAERFKRFLSEECEKRFRDMVPLEEHVATAFRFHRDTGGVDFYSVRSYTPERPGATVVIVKDRLLRSWWGLTFRLPDPAQTIPLMVGEAAVPGQPTPVPVTLRVGDKAVIRARTIADRNGHPVPDDTPVRFFFQYDGDPAPKVQEAATLDGMARAEFVLDKVGRLLIRASSEPGLGSTVLEITIRESGGVTVATVAPTPTPTATRIPAPSRTPTLTSTPTATPLPGPVEAFISYKPQNAQWGELVLALIGVAALGGGGYGAMRQRRGDLADALRAGLWCDFQRGQRFY